MDSKEEPLLGNQKSLTSLSENQRAFFDLYFWPRGSTPNDQNTPTVTPFTDASQDFYWEKAYLEFLESQTNVDKAAKFATKTMDWVYSAFNAFYAIAVTIPGAHVTLPILNTIWNEIDAAGVGILAYRDHTKEDTWARNTNLASASQLTLGTLLSALLVDSTHLTIDGVAKLTPLGSALAGHIGTAATTALAASGSGFCFAAAMAFSCALEHREVKLHEARIQYLEAKITELETELNLNQADNYQRKNEQDKNHFLDDSQNNLNQPKFSELSQLRKFRAHQQAQLKIHERARRAWGLCALFMTTVAIVSVVGISLGASAVTFGIAAPAIASGCAFLFSAVYRHQGERIDEALSSASTAVCRFFSTGTTNTKEPEEPASSSYEAQRNTGN